MSSTGSTTNICLSFPPRQRQKDLFCTIMYGNPSIDVQMQITIQPIYSCNKYYYQLSLLQTQLLKFQLYKSKLWAGMKVPQFSHICLVSLQQIISIERNNILYMSTSLKPFSSHEKLPFVRGNRQILKPNRKPYVIKKNLLENQVRNEQPCKLKQKMLNKHALDKLFY